MTTLEAAAHSLSIYAFLVQVPDCQFNNDNNNNNNNNLYFSRIHILTINISSEELFIATN